MTSTELGYLSGVTSNIQTQLDGKVKIDRIGLSSNSDFNKILNTEGIAPLSSIDWYNYWNGSNQGSNLPPVATGMAYCYFFITSTILRSIGIGSDHIIIGTNNDYGNSDINWTSIPLSMFATNGTYYGTSLPTSAKSGQLFLLKA